MIWVLVAIIVIAIYNAERLPHLMNKIKDEVPHLVEAGKKASKEIKEKAQAAHQEKSSGKKEKTVVPEIVDSVEALEAKMKAMREAQKIFATFTFIL